MNLDVIFDEAQVTVLKTLEDKHYCTVTFKDVNINTTTETFVHDAATKNTEVLQVKHDYTVYESYTYGLNRSKTDTRDFEIIIS